MNELALFAGAGGGLLGTTHLLGWRTVAAVEIDPYRREVLLRRQLDGVLDVFPIWDDCRTFDGNPWRGLVDVVTAGFPCQPFSVAGKRRSAADERNGWPDTIRIIREVRPRYAFLENVPGLLGSGYFGRVLGDLAEAGFDAEWCVLGADDAGAPHIRKRLWILAHASEPRLEGRVSAVLPERPGEQPTGASGALADAEERTERPGLREGEPPGERRRRPGDGSCEVPDAGCRSGEGTRSGERGWSLPTWWDVEPRLGGMADELGDRLDFIVSDLAGEIP